MNTAKLIIQYLHWHFGKAFDELHVFWKNILWFFYHFFSLPLLVKTLFRPVFRIHESSAPGTGLNLELIFQNITVNMVARIVGFFMRIAVIICGGIVEFIILIFGPILFLAWFLMPALPLILILTGISWIL